jgi:hypothetical protein
MLPSMLRFTVIVLSIALCSADAQTTVRVDTGKILLEFDKSLRTRLTSRAGSNMAIADWSASESITVAGKEVFDFTFRKQKVNPLATPSAQAGR